MSLDHVLRSIEKRTVRAPARSKRGTSDPDGLLRAALDAVCANTGVQISVTGTTTAKQVAAKVSAAILRATERHSTGVDRNHMRARLLEAHRRAEARASS